MASITVTGLDQVAHKLKTVEQIALHLGPPMDKSLKHLQRRMARYPVKAKGAFSAMATDKQRKAYWAKVKSGEIDNIPGSGYRRTGTTGRKWSTKINKMPNGMTGELTNNAPGAKYVHDWQPNFIKASNWANIDDVSAKEAKAVQGYFNAAIRQLISK
jgi:hypothetical protein